MGAKLFAAEHIAFVLLGRSPIAMMNSLHSQSGPVSRRLIRAMDYVCDKWMPCDRALLEQINSILARSSSEYVDLERTLNTIQSDVSLHIFTLARLYSLLAIEGVELDGDFSAREFILEGGTDLLRLIFDDQKVLQSPHSLERADDVQKLRIFESITSAASVQMLAPTFGIDSFDGYSGSLIRQTGLLLIAWNYPTIYSHAMRAAGEGKPANSIFIEKLGFSPEVLTIELLSRWGISPGLSSEIYGLGKPECSLETTLDAVHRLYQTGEMLARANLPEIYPSAKTDWDSARKEITRRLGSAGMDIIQSACEDHLHHYRKNFPILFSPGLTFDPKLRIPLYDRDKLAPTNPYLALCQQELKDAFERIYTTVQPSGNQEQILREILHQIIPQAGFQTGCIFTINPDRLEFVPQAFIGHTKRGDFASQDLSLSNDSNSIVALAYLSPQPIVEYHIAPDGSCINRIASFIGVNSRIGVLYLEIDGEVYDKDGRTVLNQFRAIQHALSSCLR